MRYLTAVFLVFVAVQLNRAQETRVPKYEERMNDFVLNWQQLPEKRTYWAHISMDYRSPGRDAWIENLYRIALTNSPKMGRRIRVDGVTSQHTQGTELLSRYNDLVLLGKHLSLFTPGPGSVASNGLSTTVLDTEDKEAVVKSHTNLYAFEPYWVALGSFTTVKRAQNIEPMLQRWSNFQVIEEKTRNDGTYEVLLVTPNGVSATEIVFAKQPHWTPIEAKTYWDSANELKPMVAAKVQRRHVNKWKLISHTKTEWQELKQSEELSWYVPKKHIMYQLVQSANLEKDVVIEVADWRFGKDVPNELFLEESFQKTSNSFSLTEGERLFGLDGNTKK